MAATGQMAAQRYYNKASGKMETAQAMHNYHPATHAPVPAGHQMAGTKHAVITHPAPAPKPSIDLAHMNDQQRLAFAQKLVGQELSAGRLPFQQNEQQLAGRETATRENAERLAGQGNQAGATLVANQKASGEAGEQRAREAATQAVIPQGPAGTEPPSRQDALLKALGQGGINAAANSRAAGEKWAQSQQAGYQQEGTAAIQNVATRIGGERLKNKNNEAAYLAKGEGATTKLFTELTGEHDKLQAAEAATKLRREELFGKEKQNTAKNEIAVRGQNVTARGQTLTNQAAETGHRITAKNNEESRRLQKRGQDLTRASAQERTAATREHTHVYQEIHDMTHGGTKPSRAAGLKYQGLLDTAYGYAKALKAEGKKPSEVEAAMRIGEGTGKGGEEGIGYSPDVIRAAINLVGYGRLGPNDKKVAAGYGLKPELGHPEWFKTGEAPKPKPKSGAGTHPRHK